MVPFHLLHLVVVGEVLHLPRRALVDTPRNLCQAVSHLNNITRRNISIHNHIIYLSHVTYYNHIIILEAIMLLLDRHESNTPHRSLLVPVWCVKSKTFRSVSS